MRAASSAASHCSIPVDGLTLVIRPVWSTTTVAARARIWLFDERRELALPSTEFSPRLDVWETRALAQVGAASSGQLVDGTLVVNRQGGQVI
jgi:hypothetical protein